MPATTACLTVLTNSFHRTEYRTRKTRVELDTIDQTNPWSLSGPDRAFARQEAKEAARYIGR